MVGLAGVLNGFSVEDHILEQAIEKNGVISDSYGDGTEIYRTKRADSSDFYFDNCKNIYVWGEQFGITLNEVYQPRVETHPHSTAAEYTAALLKSNGLDCLANLNGQYALCMYDECDMNLYLISDRLSTHPIYYLKYEDRFAFSTDLQSLAQATNCEFNSENLVTFFALERVLGTKTVIKDVRQVPPGSILKYDIECNEIKIETYWEPIYDPIDRSYTWFVDKLSALLDDVLEEYSSNPKDRSYGLLLSGGTDSRLLASRLSKPLTGYHLNETKNLEAKTAERIAAESGLEFRFLERDDDYLATVAETGRESHGFTSWFDQAHALGFDEEIRSETDVLLCGQYGDTILSDAYMPLQKFQLPIVNWTADIPSQITTSELADYIELFDRGYFSRSGRIPDYIRTEASLRNRLENNVSERTFCNINYDGVMSLPPALMYYPITNTKTYRFYESMLQMLPTRLPFLDYRIIDFALQMPLEFYTRKDITNDVASSLDSALREIPHPTSRLKLKRPGTLHHASSLALGAKRRLGWEDSDRGPWPDHERFLRESEYVDDLFTTEIDRLDSFDWICKEKAVQTYRDHVAGENNYRELYPLVTLLCSATTES